MSSNFILEVEGLEDISSSLSIDKGLFIPIKSQGFDGVSLSAVIVAISTASIAAIAKIAVEAIKQKANVRLKIQGKDISLEIQGVSEETIIENLNKYLPEKD